MIFLNKETLAMKTFKTHLKIRRLKMFKTLTGTRTVAFTDKTWKGLLMMLAKLFKTSELITIHQKN